MALAAARPRYWQPSNKLPLVVILDDSYSMTAGGKNSPREQAISEVMELANSQRYEPVILMAAGPEPSLLPGNVNLRVGLEEWRCNKTSFNPQSAIARARLAGGPLAHILVATDHKPPQDSGSNSVKWMAFGKTRENTALTAISRSAGVGNDRCLIETTHFGSQPGTASLEIDINGVIKRHPLNLEPGEVQRLIIEAPQEAWLKATLSGDELEADNKAWLAPIKRPEVRVETRIGDSNLASLVFSALKAVDGVRMVADSPHLLITDQPQTAQTNGPWILEISARGNKKPLLGPFILNSGHPLVEGISPGGVIWNAAQDLKIPGTPIITAGNLTLLSQDNSGPAPYFHMNFALQSSTLAKTPNWPVFIWNLIKMRENESPGIQFANLPPGALVQVAGPEGETVFFTDPKGETHETVVQNGRAVWKPQMWGPHLAASGERFWPFAVNALSADESDLSETRSGDWGGWQETGVMQWQYKDLTWLFILAILFFMTCHWLLVRKTSYT